MVELSKSVYGLLMEQYQYLNIGLGLESALFGKSIALARITPSTEFTKYNSLT